ncbi:NADP-dependent oxidoreductase [Pediococcus siamensis]|uniref:NADP-dependent oxidoreductase n=1 Tax=Pediococcus siamensis TaxID=381829 RepID=UPI0039A357AF
MKRIIQENFGGIEGLQIRTVPKPRVTPFSALIKTSYVPILPWDWKGEAGELQAIHPVRLPTTIGYSFSGIVEEVGALRNQKLVGQAVFGANPGGTASEWINSQTPPIIFPVPQGVSLAAAATIIGGADTAWHAINEVLQVNPQDRVLILGASGGVGQFLVQLAKRQQAVVVATASQVSQGFVERLGADEVLAYDDVNFEKRLRALGRITKIVDAAGSAELLATVLHQLAAVDVVSLAQLDFTDLKSDQTFQFNNGRIALKTYAHIANLISSGELTAHVQTVFPFEQVIAAQLQTKQVHVRGRNLLVFNESAVMDRAQF